MSEPLDGHERDQSDPADELTRALTAPGTDAELAESERYLAMYRAEHAQRPDRAGSVVPMRRGRVARRLGAGTALAGALAIAVAGGGVAAAYAGSLPEPLQRTAHQVLGPVGVPAAAPAPAEPTRAAPRPSRKASASPSAEPTTASPTPSPSGSPSAKPSPRRTPKPDPTRTPSPRPSPSTTLLPTVTATPVVPTTSVSPSITTSPTTDPTALPTPTPTPTPTAAPVVPRAVSISSTGRRAVVDTTLAFTGSVTGARGRPASDVMVLLEQRVGNNWRRVESAPTDQDGRVTIPSAPLVQNTAFRLSVGDLRSASWPVQVTPTVSATATVLPAGGRRTSAEVVVVTDGARPGDLVRVVRTGLGGDRTIGRGRVGGDGTVTLRVPVAETPAPYAVVLPATQRHTAARTALDLPSTLG